MSKSSNSNHRYFDYSLFGRILPAAVAMLIGLLPISAAWAAVTPSSAPVASGYEIPLGELSKVKKSRPVKKEIKERRKAKGESSAQQSPLDAVTSPEKGAQAAVGIPDAASRPVPSDAVQQAVPEKTGNVLSGKPEMPQADQVRIYHNPYSYLIAGKRTSIQVVISSADSLKSVYCRFHASETAAYARVAMQMAPDTHFTYAAVLPSLSAASGSLRYSIIAIDSLGNEFRSQEYVIAVKPSTVLPGWQLEKSLGIIKIRIENREKPFEGFSDSGIIIE